MCVPYALTLPLSLDDTNNCIQPKVVASLTGKRIVQVSASYSAAYALSATGEVFSCGDNSQGQLGNGNSQRSTVFVPVSGSIEGNVVTRIASGGYSAMATTKDERIHVWGGTNPLFFIYFYIYIDALLYLNAFDLISI
jgi:alpha-tubulin suppressor-like RCC1 family protein